MEDLPTATLIYLLGSRYCETELLSDIAWQQFASSKGKPLGLPEWGTQGGDHPVFIKGMHDFIAQHAAAKGSQSVAGKFVYDCYFNAETKFKILNGSYPQAGQMYTSLTWGS